jgi:hypothetical protein
MMDTPSRANWQSLLALLLLTLVAALGGAVYFNGEDTLRIAIHQGVEGVPLTTLADEFSRDYNVAV